jgi:dTDP-4-amino-4,6-dideoxygalactose transaminase
MQLLHEINFKYTKKIDINKTNELLKEFGVLKIYPVESILIFFERILHTLLGIDDAKSIIITNTDTSALHALVHGINLYYKRHSKYATQALGHRATIQGSLSNSIILDIDIDCGLDLNLITHNIINTIDGIIVTNLFGNVVNINKYVRWSKMHNKILLFNNFESSFAAYKRKNCNNYGNGCVISLDHALPFGFNKGGVIIVDKQYGECIKKCINYDNKHILELENMRYGIECKMTDIACVYMVQYLNNFHIIKSKYQKLCTLFASGISTLKNVNLLTNYTSSCPILPYFTVFFQNKKYAHNIIYYASRGVQCRNICNKQLWVMFEYGVTISKKMVDHILCFPCHNQMTSIEINQIIKCIHDFS